jgi:hypothetical protein
MSGQYYEFKVVFCLYRKRDENDLHELVVEGVIIEPSPFDKLRTMQAQDDCRLYEVESTLSLLREV